MVAKCAAGRVINSARATLADALQNMTGDGGRRIATAGGALLLAVAEAAAFEADGAALFTPAYWQARGGLQATSRGRGSSWFIGPANGPDALCWALRHYRRGGWLATRVSLDRYLWQGENAVRAFAEWRLLAALRSRGLPVPQPVGASYERAGFTYRCDLITRRIPAAEPLSDLLARGPAPSALWHALGALLARLHAVGCDHADLNAHNILVAADGALSIIDFDRGQLRAPGPWQEDNLRRLQRSLVKVTRDLPPARFVAADRETLLAGYRGAAGPGG
jgi:3-deoxy-D-manno-octulosonic acid kinase